MCWCDQLCCRALASGRVESAGAARGWAWAWGSARARAYVSRLCRLACISLCVFAALHIACAPTQTSRCHVSVCRPRPIVVPAETLLRSNQDSQFTIVPQSRACPWAGVPYNYMSTSQPAHIAHPHPALILQSCTASHVVEHLRPN
ncbi:hypothetical protein BDZ91DRAFT_396536 [Kalaharituber pfeilii]|nr:hypothetical protein BDZ91DRAFT_396536 [Kalaharituber pfeilii]